MSHDITAADIGRRVRVTEVFDGIVLRVSGEGFTLRGHDSHSTITFGSEELGVRTSFTVERIRPTVPTGLGAVVRLDGDDGPLAVRDRVHGGPRAAWDAANGIGGDAGYSSGALTEETVERRIHAVLSEGVTP